MKLMTSLSTKSVFEVGAKSIAFFLPEKFNLDDVSSNFKTLDIDVAKFLSENKFSGAAASLVTLPVTINKTITYLCFAGIGTQDKDKKYSLETMRRAIGSVIKFACSKKFENMAFALPNATDFGVSVEHFIEQVTSIAYIASYKFDTFISTISKQDREFALDLGLMVSSKDLKAAKLGHKNGEIIGQAVNNARHLIDMPPSQTTPKVLADYAEKVAKEHGLKCTVYSEEEIKKMGLNGIAGVSAGSSQDAKFVILEYKTKKKNAQTLAFVGKGITFDSGGLSIKPANSMENMKDDMSGAASVINVMAAIAQLEPEVNVVGLAPITENMPGCSAQKPGDIVTFYNGVTAEVRNTDAEGRLVLADALAYAAKHFKPDAMIDVATLTGACIYAVGPFFSALLSDDEMLSEEVLKAAKTSGDAVWKLPFTPDFKEAVKSSVADIQNIGNPAIAAGTITAGWFLRHFTADIPWVHVDIASTAFDVPNISYYGKGATGSSVRLLIDIARNWKK